MRPLNRVKSQEKAAVSMRISGAPLEKITEVCGFKSVADTQRAIERALAKVVEPEDFETARALYLGRLDTLLASCWDRAIDSQDPEQIPYIKTVLAIEERRAKLTGADAPTRHEVYTPTAEQIEAHVQTYMRVHPGVVVEAEIVGELDPSDLDDDPAQPALPMTAEG